MSGAAALSACDKLGSGIIICGYRLRDMLCTELYDDMPKGFEMLLLSSPSVRGELRGAQGLHIVEMPIKASELTDKLWELEAEIDEKRRYKKKAALHGRKGRSEEENRLIDGAKILLMEKRGMEEVEACSLVLHGLPYDDIRDIRHRAAPDPCQREGAEEDEGIACKGDQGEAYDDA